MKPPQYPRSGDLVEAEIEFLGSQRQHCYLGKSNVFRVPSGVQTDRAQSDAPAGICAASLSRMFSRCFHIFDLQEEFLAIVTQIQAAADCRIWNTLSF